MISRFIFTLPWRGESAPPSLPTRGREVNRFVAVEQQGFIALISVVIISAILLIITFSAGFTNFFTRFTILDSENKKISVGLAEACMEIATLQLSQDSNWQPAGTPVTVDGTKTCRICPIVPSGSQRTVYTRAVYNSAYTNLEALVTPSAGDITIDSWQETPVTGSSSCPLP